MRAGFTPLCQLTCVAECWWGPYTLLRGATGSQELGNWKDADWRVVWWDFHGKERGQVSVRSTSECCLHPERKGRDFHKYYATDFPTLHCP